MRAIYNLRRISESKIQEKKMFHSSTFLAATLLFTAAFASLPTVATVDRNPDIEPYHAKISSLRQSPDTDGSVHILSGCGFETFNASDIETAAQKWRDYCGSGRTLEYGSKYWFEVGPIDFYICARLLPETICTAERVNMTIASVNERCGVSKEGWHNFETDSGDDAYGYLKHGQPFCWTDEENAS
jgi:hypothetical protein